MNGRTVDLISVQSDALWAVVSSSLEAAFPLYQEHPGRPPLPLNIHASAAVVLLVVSLESHVNRLMHFKPAGLNTGKPLTAKIEKYLPGDPYAVLRTHLTEVTVCRDAVAHALLWESTLEQDDHGRTTAQTWRLDKITKTRQKAQENVNLSGQPPRTHVLDLNVVPTLVDFMDAVKALVVICRVMRALEHEHGNPAAWVGPIPADVQMQRTFPIEPATSDPEGWIEAILRRLHLAHRDDVVSRFGIVVATFNGELAFAGVGGRP